VIQRIIKDQSSGALFVQFRSIFREAQLDHRGEKEIGRRQRPRPNKLGVGRDDLAVIIDMRLGRFRSVVHSVFVVTAS